MIDAAVKERLRDILARAGLPTEAPRIGAAKAFELMQMDKKVLAGTVRLVLLEKLGRAIVTDQYPKAALEVHAGGAFRMSGARAVRRPCASIRAAAAIPSRTPEYRSEYQRDRDRIVHSTAFRRLVYKTQVFVNHEGDLYRTRLTHSLEVAQIARTVARAHEAQRGVVRSHLPGPRSWPYAVWPCRAGCIERMHEPISAASSTTCNPCAWSMNSRSIMPNSTG